MNKFLNLFSRFSLLIALVIGIHSCDSGSPEESQLTLRFKAKFEGNPLVLYDDYTYNGLPIRVTTLRFFISDVYLLKSGGGEVKVLDVADIDCYKHHSLPETAADGEPVYLSNMPPGDYEGIRFGVGVVPTLNAKTPSDFSNNSPLNDASNYWESWSSYIHTKFEGKVDTIGGNPFDAGFLFHIGQDPLYREVTLLKNISITDGNVQDFNIQLDVEKLLTSPTGVNTNLLVENFTHSPIPNNPYNIIQYNLSVKIADNMSNAFQVE